MEKALTVYPEVRHLFVPCNYIDETGEVLQEPNYCDGYIHKYTGKEYVMAYQSVGHPIYIDVRESLLIGIYSMFANIEQKRAI